MNDTYRVRQVVVTKVELTFILTFLQFFLAALPILPNFQLPMQDEAVGGTFQININSTHVTTTCLTLYQPSNRGLLKQSEAWRRD